MKGGTVTDARVGLGAVAPTVLLVDEAAKALIGSKLDDAALDAAADACSRRLQADRRQARHHQVPHQDRRRAAQAQPRDRIAARTAAPSSWESLNMAKIHVTTTINGDADRVPVRADQTLLDVLRDSLGLTGSKEGCGSGDCGACSVMVDGRLVCSCLVLGAEAEGAKVETIEGMAEGDKLHPLQQKFLEMAALQCGICTPGFLMRPRRCSTQDPEPDRGPRSATGWPATSAAAPATTRSSLRSWTWPPK